MMICFHVVNIYLFCTVNVSLSGIFFTGNICKRHVKSVTQGRNDALEKRLYPSKWISIALVRSVLRRISFPTCTVISLYRSMSKAIEFPEGRWHLTRSFALSPPVAANGGSPQNLDNPSQLSLAWLPLPTSVLRRRMLDSTHMFRTVPSGSRDDDDGGDRRSGNDGTGATGEGAIAAEALKSSSSVDTAGTAGIAREVESSASSTPQATRSTLGGLLQRSSKTGGGPGTQQHQHQQHQTTVLFSQSTETIPGPTSISSASTEVVPPKPQISSSQQQSPALSRKRRSSAKPIHAKAGTHSWVLSYQNTLEQDSMSVLVTRWVDLALKRMSLGKEVGISLEAPVPEEVSKDDASSTISDQQRWKRHRNRSGSRLAHSTKAAWRKLEEDAQGLWIALANFGSRIVWTELDFTPMVSRLMGSG